MFEKEQRSRVSRRGRLGPLRPFERRKVCFVDAGTDTVIGPLSYLGVIRAILEVGPQRNEEGRLGPGKSRCMAHTCNPSTSETEAGELP